MTSVPSGEPTRAFRTGDAGLEATAELIRNAAGRYPLSEYVMAVNLIAAVLDHGTGEAAHRLFVIRQVLTALSTVRAERGEGPIT